MYGKIIIRYVKNRITISLLNITKIAISFYSYTIYLNDNFQECKGIVFVVDSSDRCRMIVAKDELDMLLQVRRIRNVVDGKCTLGHN